MSKKELFLYFFTGNFIPVTDSPCRFSPLLPSSISAELRHFDEQWMLPRGGEVLIKTWRVFHRSAKTSGKMRQFLGQRMIQRMLLASE